MRRRQKQASRRPRSLGLSLGMLALSLALLLGGAIGTARAVPLIESQYYTAGVQMYDIGVTLLENGVAVGSRDYVPNSEYVWAEGFVPLLGNLLKEGESFQLGRQYPEALAVRNSGSIDEYVRVNLYKYWIDKNGEKIQTLSPDRIRLNITPGGGWVVDPKAGTTERTVLYYTEVLPVGATTPTFTDTLTVDGKLPYQVKQSEKDGVITTTYDYEGVSFQIEAEVDAVQTHNAEQAIWSAWGRQVSLSGTSLTLK